MNCETRLVALLIELQRLMGHIELDTTGPSALLRMGRFSFVPCGDAAFSEAFPPVDDQIELLKERGMEIRNEALAKRCLRRVGYYRLSAYWYPFREFHVGPVVSGTPAPIRSDLFVPGATFEEVFQFYVFDKKLRVYLMDGLERIEVAMRAIISDLLGARDTHAHRSPVHLDAGFVREKYTRWLTKQDSHFARSREDFAEHFRSRYPSDEPPIWIACEVWDWGMLSHFFGGMKPRDKDLVANRFGVNGRQLETWLRAMNDVRNICAHHSRLWNRGLTVIPRLPVVGAVRELDHLPRTNQSLSRLYTVLVLMRVMLQHIHPTRSDWHRRVAGHALAGPTSPLINASTSGFPAGWETQPIWL